MQFQLTQDIVIDLTMLKMVKERMTFREMAKQLGVSSPNTISKRIQDLVERKLVERTEEKKARNYRLTQLGEKMLEDYHIVKPGS